MMSKNRHETKAARTPVAREEYDFSDVPEDELERCLYYEYMRESEAIIREVGNVRRRMWDEVKCQKNKPDVPAAVSIKISKITKHQGLFMEAMSSILACCSEFPEVPWQRLSVSAKKRLGHFVGKATQMHNKHFRKQLPPLVLDTYLKTPALGEITLNAWKSRMTPKQCQKIPASDREGMLVSGFFQINTGYLPDQLIDDFREWVKVNHPKGHEEPKERRGRKSKRDALNALGALRLRYHCRTLGDAQKLIAPLAAKPHGMGLGERRNWERPCKAAVKHFAELLALPGQYPIHFTKGWQK